MVTMASGLPTLVAASARPARPNQTGPATPVPTTAPAASAPTHAPQARQAGPGRRGAERRCSQSIPAIRAALQVEPHPIRPPA